jgi:hypothetical protein
VNQRANDLVVTLRGVLGILPGATAISFHAFSAWTYLLISASTDAAVRALSHDLGLGAPVVRPAGTVWWFRAMSESGHGEVCVEVAGPHYPRRPPAQ